MRRRRLKPHVLVGIVLGGLIIAGSFVVPRVLRSSAAVAASTARQGAEQARHRLASFDLDLGQLARHVDVEQIKQADLEQLLSDPDVQTRLDAVRSDLEKVVRAAQAEDRRLAERGVSPSELRPMATGAAAVRSAADTLAASVRENQNLLRSALEAAREAADADRGVAVANHAVGMIELARAADELTQAANLRIELEAALADLFSVASRLQNVRSELDQCEAYDVAPALEQLAAESEKAAAALQAAQQRRDELSARVTQLEGELAQVRSELDQARRELLELERAGFTPGDDDSFESYRQRYRELSDRLARAQEREQLLRFGGLKGVTFEQDDAAEGAATGGEPVEGIDSLRLQLDAATDNAARWQGAREALDQQAAFTRSGAELVAETRTRLAAQAKELQTQLDAAKARVVELASQGFERESAVLSAARQAEDAFGRAGSAASNWVSQAQTLRREKDTKNQNERLAMITRDSYVQLIGPTGQAEAQMLAGHAFAMRIAALDSTLRQMTRITEMVPGFAFDAAETQQLLATAREEGMTTLNKALAVYQRLAGQQGPTTWVFQASLGYAYALMAQVDPAQAESYRAQMLQWVGQAVTGREQWPYLQWHVAVLRQLGGGAAPAPETPENGDVEDLDGGGGGDGADGG